MAHHQPRDHLALASAYQNDFVARMDWTIKPYREANHPPVPKLGHPAELTARAGERVDLSAEGSTDPDGDALSYEWFCYAEAGTLGISSQRSGQPLEIKGFDQPKAWFTVPDRPCDAARHGHDAHHPRRHRPRHASTDPLPASDHHGPSLAQASCGPLRRHTAGP